MLVPSQAKLLTIPSGRSNVNQVGGIGWRHLPYVVISMSKSTKGQTAPKSMRHKQILDVAAENPEASIAELAAEVRARQRNWSNGSSKNTATRLKPTRRTRPTSHRLNRRRGHSRTRPPRTSRRQSARRSGQFSNTPPRPSEISRNARRHRFDRGNRVNGIDGSTGRTARRSQTLVLRAGDRVGDPLR